MNVENEKCVIVVNENLPLGIIANTAAILGITMGMKMPDVVGNNVIDSDGNPPSLIRCDCNGCFCGSYFCTHIITSKKRKSNMKCIAPS